MTTDERRPWLYRAIYGSGEWNGAITSTTRSLFLNYFLVSVVGLNIGSVGRILFIGRIWDAINDPLVGVVSDRFQSRMGRRRPLMLGAALPMAVSFALLWWRPGFLGESGLVAYFLVLSIVLDTALTVFSVPHTALLAELTNDYEDRISFTVWRNLFFLLGALVVAATFKLAAEDLFGRMGPEPDVLKGYLYAGWIFGATLLIAPLLVVAVIRENPNLVRPTERNPFRLFVQAFANQPFRALSTAYFLAFSGLEIVVVTFVWFLNIVLQVKSPWDSAITGILLASALFALPLVNLLVRRVGKKKAYIIVSLVWSAFMPVIALLPGGDLRILIPVFIVAGTIYSAGITVPWTMLPDVMEYDELHTGVRSEGLFASYMVFFRKLGSAAVTLIANFILGQVGFVEGTYVTGAAQPATVVTTLRLLFGVAPVILILTSLIWIRRYPITKEYHEELKRQLRDAPSPQTG